MKESQPKATTVSRWPWHPISAIFIVLALFLVPQIVAGIIIGAAARGNPAITADLVLEQFLYVFLAEALTLAGLYGVLRQSGKGFRFLGLTKPKWFDTVYVILGFAAYFALNIALVSVLSSVLPGLDVDQKQDIGFDTARSFISLVPVFIALVVLAPLAEEVLIRGFLFGSLRSRMTLPWSILLTSIIFGAAHLFGGEPGAPLLWIAAIDTFALSVVLCYLREKTGRLWAGIGLHALKNCIAFVALFVLHISS
jgi:membrane protease YdiL (CAAX protease family)